MFTPEPFSREALEFESDLFRQGHLRQIKQEGLAARLDDEIGLNPRIRSAYSEAVVDFGAIVEEIRFHGALAALLIADYRQAAKSQEPKPGADKFRDRGIPIEVMALLGAYMAPLPTPSHLFIDRHMAMSGNRVLSLWVAGQLLDSSLFRLVAALDRLAIILWTAAGKPVAGRYPEFRSRDVSTLSGAYPAEPLAALRALCDHEILKFVRSARRGFTHTARFLSELHGHYRVAYDTGERGTERGRLVQAMDSGTHLAMLLASYNEVLIPAVNAVIACVESPAGAGQAGSTDD